MSVLALLLACVLPQESNRTWFVDVEVRGPAEELRLDCGPDGVTIAEGPFLAGESRQLRLPVPVHDPLGANALAGLPLPAVEVVPASQGSARVLRWSEEQPAARIAGVAARLQPRLVAPVETSRPRAQLPELFVVALAGVVAWRVRARPWAALSFGLAAAVLGGWLAARRSTVAPPSQLLLFDAAEPLALASRAARGALALSGDALEVEPSAASIELRVDAAGEGVAHAPATLRVLEVVPAPALSVAANAWRPFDAVWTREPSGGWEPRGSWPVGEPLPGIAASGADPPGWLAAVPVDGRGALVGRTAEGEWVRATGFGD